MDDGWQMQGRASRKSAAAAIEAHLAVTKGEPLRRAISEALAQAKNLGGQERRFVAFATRELSRHQRLLDLYAKKLGHPPSEIGLKEDAAIVRYALWRRMVCGEDWERFGHEVKLPGPVRPRTIHDRLLEALSRAPRPELEVDASTLEGAATLHSLTRWLSEALAAEVPDAERAALFASLNREPELILRVRPHGTRDEVLAMLAAEGVTAEALPLAPDAIRLPDGGGRVFESAPMKQRRLQVQDLGSQLIVACCRPSREQPLTGAAAADLCAGAGGKTLALADAVGPQGRVLASDLSQRRLHDARERVSELGLRNVHFAVPAQPGRADVILIDAPCSGTGSLRREPDQKWKLSAKSVAEMVAKQRQLLADTAEAAKPGALIVYATCSLLRAENEDRVRELLQSRPDLELEDCRAFVPDAACRGPFLRTFPHRVPGGGFFAARLRKRAR